MRTAPRYYLVGDDGQVHRLAQKTFFRILAQKKATPFPDFAPHPSARLRARRASRIGRITLPIAAALSQR